MTRLSAPLHRLEVRVRPAQAVYVLHHRHCCLNAQRRALFGEDGPPPGALEVIIQTFTEPPDADGG